MELTIISDFAKQLGYDNLKNEQLEVISQYMQERDCYFSAPTGFGKSVLFQMAPLLFDHQLKTDNAAVIVIVPTVSLALDTVSKLKHIRPETLSIHLTRAMSDRAKDATYIICCPEAIIGDNTILSDVSLCKRIKVIFIDESHIVKSW